jgi:hypothetical protein
VLAGSVAIQAQRIESQHRIDRVQEELLQAERRNRELRADVAVAESPERIMAAANDLGMVEPGPVLPLVPEIERTDPTASVAPAPANEPPTDAVPSDGGTEDGSTMEVAGAGG